MFPVLGGKFKSSAQDSDLEYLFWQQKKSPVSSDLKPPLVHIRLARIDYLLPVFYIQDFAICVSDNPVKKPKTKIFLFQIFVVF